MLMRLVEMVRVFLSPSRSVTEDHKLDYAKIDLDLLSNIFGFEEARKHLLQSPQMDAQSPEQVLKDSLAMELMLKTYPWKLYEQAVWRRVLGALRDSLGSESLEKREGARQRVLAHLSDLHLPFELRWEADRIKKMQELTRVAQQKI